MNANEAVQRLLKLRVAAYACHESARDQIEKTVRSSPILSFCRLHFYAYFCERPVIRRSGARVPDPALYALFIDREITRRNVSLELSVDAIRAEKTAFLRQFKNDITASLAGQPLQMRLAYTDNRKILKEWYRYSRLGPISAGTLACRLFTKWWADPKDVGAIRLDPSNDPLKRDGCLNDIRNKARNGALSLDEKLAYVNLFALLYHGLVTSSNADDCIFFSAAPICTSRTFHGVLMAVIESPGGCKMVAEHGPEVSDARELVDRDLCKQAENTYLPTLILFQNSCEEQKLDEHLKTLTRASMERFSHSRNGRVYSLFPSLLPIIGSGGTSPNELLESQLGELWGRRLNSPKSNTGRKAVKNSLVFNEMLVASPGLIETVRSAAELRLSLATKPPLPAVLIVAPPGAGKESLSKLIPVFSDDFWNKPRVAFNMGSIMLDAEGHKDGFRGILQNLKQKKLKQGGVVVLDELNSLNISAQPMLLRILEQGEIALSSADGETALPWLFIG
ncbi:MAG: hypothetical protein EPO07_17845, partial [Verrucomicrobia bacterium]